MGSVWGASDVLIGCVSVALEVLVVVSVALEVVVTGVSVSVSLVEEEKDVVIDGSDVVSLEAGDESLAFLPHDINRIKSRKSMSDTDNFFMRVSPWGPPQC